MTVNVSAGPCKICGHGRMIHMGVTADGKSEVQVVCASCKSVETYTADRMDQFVIRVQAVMTDTKAEG